MKKLALQRWKLFSKPDIKKVVNHKKEECSTDGLIEGETFMLDVLFSIRSTMEDAEDWTLFYMLPPKNV